VVDSDKGAVWAHLQFLLNLFLSSFCQIVVTCLRRKTYGSGGLDFSLSFGVIVEIEFDFLVVFDLSHYHSMSNVFFIPINLVLNLSDLLGDKYRFLASSL